MNSPDFGHDHDMNKKNVNTLDVVFTTQNVASYQ